MALITKAELREHVETPLADAALDRLIDAKQAELDAWAGVFTPATTSPSAPIANVTESIYGPGTSILPLRQVPDPAHIASVTVYYSSLDPGRALDATEYYVRGSGLAPALPGGYWPWKTVVVYRPLDSLALRKMALIDLCALDLERKRGIASESIGDWSESYASEDDYQVAHDEILLRVFSPAPFA